jgi:Na+/H+ antiporter NhaD/arsenite permease-like protein
VTRRPAFSGDTRAGKSVGHSLSIQVERGVSLETIPRRRFISSLASRHAPAAIQSVPSMRWHRISFQEVLMYLAIILFILTYLMLLALPRWRAPIALGSAALFILLGLLSPQQALASVDLNVLLVIAGTMGIVSLFIDSQMPVLLADLILERTPDVKCAIVALSLFDGIISAFVDNVATVLMIAPVALVIARRLKINPVTMVIAISVSSNLQGAATLVGDTPSILLGGYAGMDFLDFFFIKGKLGIFWAVELGAAVSAIVLLYLLRHETMPISAHKRTVVTDYMPTFLLTGTVLLLIGASFLPEKPALTNGLICLFMLGLGLIWTGFTKRSWAQVLMPLKEIDYATLALLSGLFIIIGGITHAGVVDVLAQCFVAAGADNPFLIYTLIVWASVLFSAFIDNIPYVAAMLPVVQGIAAMMGIEPYVLYFGLLSGATLGGNLTPIGASANITAIGILRKEGWTVKNRDFLRIGLPFTLSAVTAGYLLIWLIWGF